MAVNPDGTVAAEPNPSPQGPDYSGVALYKKASGDWTKANDSYFNAVKELGSTHDALKTQMAETQRLQDILRTAVGGGGSVNQDPLAELEAMGIPVDAIQRAIDSRVNARVDSTVVELFQPIMSQMNAEETLSSEIENFDQHKSAARAFMAENPEVAAVFNAIRPAKPVEAWKYAIRESLIAKASSGPNPSRPTGLPGSSTPAVRGNEPMMDQGKREQEALDYGHKYGDMSPYRNERFKGTSVERAVQAGLRQAGLAPGSGEQGW